jgi:ribonuclease P/MRP protein subunit RPP1
MKFYDICVQSSMGGGENSIEQVLDFAKRLGYSGIAICDIFQSVESLEKLKAQIASTSSDIEIHSGVIIQAKTVSEMKEVLTKVRDMITVVAVSGGDYEINRAACEDPRVDVLLHPEYGRYDNGLDEPCMNLARENNVAIGVGFREILDSYRKPRSYLLQNVAKNINLCQSFKTPIILTSAAHSVWDMRSPRDMVALANVLDMDIASAFSSMSSTPSNIISENTKTLEGRKITDGVEVV